MSEGYNIPIFFSETGCNVGGDRTFADQAAIFGPDMIDTWSGSIIYEWVQEANDYGLVTYPGDSLSGTPVEIQPDFNNLAHQWKLLSPSSVAEADYESSFSAPACPASTAGGWLINGQVTVPTLGPEIVAAAAASVKPTSYPSVAHSSTAVSITSAGASSTRTGVAETSGSSGTATGTATARSGTSSSGAAGTNILGSVIAVGVVIFGVMLM